MCPDENELTQFARGGATALPELEAHLDGCEKCRRAVAAAVSDQTLPRQKPTRELSPGVRIDRYEIERELGRGGMGVVYQARDVTLDRRVALKLLHARRDEVAQARLLREAQVMAKLAHPNVVPIFELGEWKNDLYLVMELITGVTLEAWLKRAKHRSEDIVAHFVQAGRGLAAAHAAGVVHRDFKPANVLVGLDERVRVTDFGLSRPLPTLELPATNSPVVTRTGAIVGTLAYMAPEQLGGKIADERSDQFSFCISLAEALCGQRPFQGETWVELAQSLAAKPRFGAGISARLRGVLSKGLELNPAHRYASMTALLNAIERAQSRPWKAAAVFGLAATIALGLFSLFRLQHAPPRVITLKPELAPVMVAATDLSEGTVVTERMLEQRDMPKDYLSASILTPERTKEFVGQALKTRVRKGDPLLWTHVSANAWIVVFKRDTPAGTELSRKFIEERQVPGELASGDVVTSKDFWNTFGKKLAVAQRAGEVLHTSMLENPNARPVEASLTEQDIDDYLQEVKSFEQEAKCWNLKSRPRDKKVRLAWQVSAEGVPYDVETVDWFRDDEPAVQCLLDMIKSWRFPARSKPTERFVWTYSPH
jgi:serine/threonine-protein kinase